MNSTLIPATKDPDTLIDQFAYYLDIFESSASDAEAWERKVKFLNEDLEDAEKAKSKEKSIADDLRRANAKLTDNLALAMRTIPELEATKKRNYELVSQIDNLKVDLENTKRNCDERIVATTAEMEAEKTRLRSESEASLAAWRKDAEKRDAANEFHIDQLRQTAQREKAEIVSEFEKKLDRKLAAAEKQHKFQADAQARDLVKKIESLTKNEEWMRCKLEQERQLVAALRTKISTLERKLDDEDFENRGKRNVTSGSNSGKRAASSSILVPKPKRRDEPSGADARRVTFDENRSSLSSSSSSSIKGILKRDHGVEVNECSSNKKLSNRSGEDESRLSQAASYSIDDDELPDCVSVTMKENADLSLSTEPLDLSPKSSSSQLARQQERGVGNANRAWGQSGTIPPLDTTTRRPKAVKTALTFS